MRPYPTVDRMVRIRDAAVALEAAITAAIHLCGVRNRTTPDPRARHPEFWARAMPPLVAAAAALHQSLRMGNRQLLKAEQIRHWDDRVHKIFTGVSEPEVWDRPIPGLAAWVKALESRLRHDEWPAVDQDDVRYISTAARDLNCAIAEWMFEHPKATIAGAVSGTSRPTPECDVLTPVQRTVLRILKQLAKKDRTSGLTGPELRRIVSEGHSLSIGQSTLTSSVIPGLKPHGVRNVRGRGYFWTKP